MLALKIITSTRLKEFLSHKTPGIKWTFTSGAGRGEAGKEKFLLPAGFSFPVRKKKQGNKLLKAKFCLKPGSFKNGKINAL